MYSVLLEKEMNLIVEQQDVDVNQSTVAKGIDVVVNTIVELKDKLVNILSNASKKGSFKKALPYLAGGVAFGVLAILFKKLLKKFKVEEDAEKDRVNVGKWSTIALSMICVMIGLYIILKKRGRQVTESTKMDVDAFVNSLLMEEEEEGTLADTSEKGDGPSDKQDAEELKKEAKGFLTKAWGWLKAIYSKVVGFFWDRVEKTPTLKGVVTFIAFIVGLVTIIVLIRRYRMKELRGSKELDESTLKTRFLKAGATFFKYQTIREKLALATLCVFIVICVVSSVFTVPKIPPISRVTIAEI